MIHEYGMGISLISREDEATIIMKKLYDETMVLLSSLQNVLKNVEEALRERESITKMDVKRRLDEVL
jgi:hypothetical protein